MVSETNHSTTYVGTAELLSAYFMHNTVHHHYAFTDVQKPGVKAVEKEVSLELDEDLKPNVHFLMLKINSLHLLNSLLSITVRTVQLILGLLMWQQQCLNQLIAVQQTGSKLWRFQWAGLTFQVLMILS